MGRHHFKYSALRLCLYKKNKFMPLKQLAFLFLLLGCQIFQTPINARDAEETSVLASVLQTSQMSGCQKNLNPGWQFYSVHRNLRVISHDDRLVLLYEAVSRQSIKTIWQPLNKKFKFEGEGIQLGIKDAAETTDFQIITTQSGDSVSTFRFRSQGRELFQAAIEFVPKSGASPLQRYIVPARPGASIQNIWVLEKPQSPQKFNVVVKSYLSHQTDDSRSELSTEKETDLVTQYSLFSLDIQNKSISIVTEYSDFDSRLEYVHFVSSHLSAEPIAIAIEQLGQSVYSSSYKAAHQNIIAQKIFNKDKNRTILFKGQNTVLGSLDVNLSHTNSLDRKRILSIAWVSESSNGKGNYIQWLSMPLEASKTNRSNQDEFSKLFQTSDLSKNTQIQTLKGFIKTQHFPIELQFRTFGSESPSSKQDKLWLSWHAALDSDIAHISTKIFPATGIALKPRTTPQTLSVLVEETKIAMLGKGHINNETGQTVIIYGQSERKQNEIPREMRNEKIGLCVFDLEK